MREEDGSPRAVFELCDAVPAGPETDLLGLWTMVPSGAAMDQTPAGDMAFGAPEMMAGQAPVWRANFPADPNRIATHLGEAKNKLATAQAALAATPARLDAFVAQGQAGLSYSYSLPAPGAGPTRPEDELSLLLAGIQGGGPMMDYGVGDQFVGKWKEARQVFQAFADRLQQMIAHFAWVETRVAGDTVGRTRVTWTGDVDTFLQDQLEPDRMRLHQHTLNVALVSRRTLLRTSTLVISGAVKLSVLLATPGGLVLIFPAVLRFINQVRELEERQRI